MRDLRVDAARQIDLAGCLQKARVFGATPGIGTATFRVDDASNGELLSTFRTLPSRAFQAGFAGARDCPEGMPGSIAGDQKQAFAVNVPEPTTVRRDIATISTAGTPRRSSMSLRAPPCAHPGNRILLHRTGR
ncbi:hypothetical protein FDP22_12725 [Paroceanicella profunda]|uniref:Uncharacterized protein n=1 Tax=Paroceanicella profunda TaxID=2579971 RepID=A0A5B8G0J4_9RHOB|nr:hypothetical protein [Paroceanicella profunda]QDL92572.1 hypothetical protein FDP22_12725 [Paroceanicella profunda]